MVSASCTLLIEQAYWTVARPVPEWIVSRTLYQPIVEEVLAAWGGREIRIILDGCFIRAKALQILRLSLSHCYRALPLAWEVVTDKGNVELEVCKTMLEHVAKLLVRMRRVTFLADRGFRSREWARLCRTLDWDYIIRIANNTIITFPSSRNYRVPVPDRRKIINSGIPTARYAPKYAKPPGCAAKSNKRRYTNAAAVMKRINPKAAKL